MAGLKDHVRRLQAQMAAARAKRKGGANMARRAVAGVLKHSPIVSTHARGKRARTPVTPFVVADGDDDVDARRSGRRRRLDSVDESIDGDEDDSPVTKKSRTVTAETRRVRSRTADARGKRSRAQARDDGRDDVDDDEDDVRARRRRRLDASGASIDDDEDASPVTKKAKKAQKLDEVIEARHRAAAEYRQAQGARRSTHRLADELAKKYKVGSGRTLRRFVATQKAKESLKRKPGSGADPTVLTEEFGEIVQELMVAKRGEWTVTRLVKAYNLAARKKGAPTASRASVGRWLKANCTRRRRLTKPLLTPEHKKNRVAFAKDLLARWDDVFHRPGHVRVFVDEVQVFAYSPNRFQYVPHALRELFNKNPLRLKSKTKIPKLMFMAGFAKRNLEHNFSGLVAFFPIVEYEEAQKNSKYFKKGQWRAKAVTVNKNSTVEWVKDMVELIATRQSWVSSSARCFLHYSACFTFYSDQIDRR